MVERDDLDVFFGYQLDAESSDLAKVYPRDRAGFDGHWGRILDDPEVIARAIVWDGVSVGFINVFRVDDDWFVGYWIDRGHWGKGIATRALVEILEIVERRPLLARVSSENIGSIRILQRCGFEQTHECVSEGCDRYMACTEAWFELK